MIGRVGYLLAAGLAEPASVADGRVQPGGGPGAAGARGSAAGGLADGER